MLPLLILLACSQVEPDPKKDAQTHSFGETRNEPYDPNNPWWQSPAENDADSDGFTVEDGDCDDLNPTVHPGVAADLCDGRDNDCDGLIDEDVDGDWGETDILGDLTDTPETYLYPKLFPETDVDRFVFYVEDTLTGWFDIEVWLYQIPDDCLLYTSPSPRD